MASDHLKYKGLHSEIPDSTTTNNPDSEPVIPTAPVTTTAPKAPNNSGTKRNNCGCLKQPTSSMPPALEDFTVVRQQGPPPENHMAFAICSLFCCIGLGIVAIVKSSQVNTLWAQGKHEEAKKAAASAKAWGFRAVSFTTFLLVLVIVWFGGILLI